MLEETVDSEKKSTLSGTRLVNCFCPRAGREEGRSPIFPVAGTKDLFLGCLVQCCSPAFSAGSQPRTRPLQGNVRQIIGEVTFDHLEHSNDRRSCAA